MTNYKTYLQNFIAQGLFNYEDMAYKLDKMYIENKLTEEERDELLILAAENANDAEQINIYNKLVDLEHRIVALETADIPIWVSGYHQKGRSCQIRLQQRWRI